MFLNSEKFNTNFREVSQMWAICKRTNDFREILFIHLLGECRHYFKKCILSWIFWLQKAICGLRWNSICVLHFNLHTILQRFLSAHILCQLLYRNVIFTSIMFASHNKEFKCHWTYCFLETLLIYVLLLASSFSSIFLCYKFYLNVLQMKILCKLRTKK